LQAEEQEIDGHLEMLVERHMPTPADLHRQMLKSGARKVDRVVALRAIGASWNEVVRLVGGSLNSARVLAWKRENPERNAAWARNWRTKEENRQKQLAATRSWRSRNPDRLRYYRHARTCRESGCQPLSFEEWVHYEQNRS
jgi:hypothetical protein